MKRILSLALICAMLLSIVPFTVVTADETPVTPQTVTETVYDEIVTDDAYIRGNSSDNRGKNFNSETVKVDDNTTVNVVNIKYQGGDINTDMNEIISLFKVKIPSVEEIEAIGAENFAFQFTVFRNPDKENGPETYEFLYIAGSDMKNYLGTYDKGDWSESSVTWNWGNIKWITTRYYDDLKAAINNPQNKLDKINAIKFGSLTVEKNEDYLAKSDEEKVIRLDMTEYVKALAAAGEETITIFAYARDAIGGNGTSLMIHSKETPVVANRPRLVGTKQTEVKPVDNSEKKVKEWLVTEDAYIRGAGNSGKNYNSEYCGNDNHNAYDTLVLNVKNQGTNVINAVMKVNIPTDNEASKIDNFAFQFTVFKNPDYREGDQKYIFCYVTEDDIIKQKGEDWKEDKVTWDYLDNIATRDSAIAKKFGELSIAKYERYEIKSAEDKVITLDMTDDIKALAAAGVKTITIFAYAENDIGTSLMFHSKDESVDERSNYNDERCPRLIGTKHVDKTLEQNMKNGTLEYSFFTQKSNNPDSNDYRVIGLIKEEYLDKKVTVIITFIDGENEKSITIKGEIEVYECIDATFDGKTEYYAAEEGSFLAGWIIRGVEGNYEPEQVTLTIVEE